MTEITQEDVDVFMESLRRKGTPWADGCAALIGTLWNGYTPRPEAVPPALQMALGNHSIGVFDAAGKLLAADADVYAAPESKPERADTAELVYRLQAYTTSFGSDTEGLSLLPEAWNTLRADIEEACRVLAVPSPLAPSTQEKP